MKPAPEEPQAWCAGNARSFQKGEGQGGLGKWNQVRDQVEGELPGRGGDWAGRWAGPEDQPQCPLKALEWPSRLMAPKYVSGYCGGGARQKTGRKAGRQLREPRDRCSGLNFCSSGIKGRGT